MQDILGKTYRVCPTVVGALLQSYKRFRHLMIYLYNVQSAQILLYTLISKYTRQSFLPRMVIHCLGQLNTWI